MDIKEALGTLDKSNDDHWTADGLPRIDVVSAIVGEKVTRAQISEADPDFTREVKTDENDTPPAETTPPENGTDELTEISEISLDDICAMPVQELAQDRELLEHGLAMAEADALVKADLHKKATQALAESEKRVRALRQLNAATKPKDNPIGDFIKAQNAARAARGAKARSFIEQGTNASDVRAALDTKAPIDKAMAGRKPARGAQRPVRGQMN